MWLSHPFELTFHSPLSPSLPADSLNMPSTSKRREPNGLTEALAASLGKQERKQRLRGEEAERDLRVDLFLSLPFDLLAEVRAAPSPRSLSGLASC